MSNPYSVPEGWKEIDWDKTAKVSDSTGLEADAHYDQMMANTLSMGQVALYLSMTMPEVNQEAAKGNILAIGKGWTARFPAWQFELDDEGIELKVSIIVRHLIGVFRQRYSPQSANVHLNEWSARPNPELDGHSPASWVLANHSTDQLLAAASHHLEL